MQFRLLPHQILTKFLHHQLLFDQLVYFLNHVDIRKLSPFRNNATPVSLAVCYWKRWWWFRDRHQFHHHQSHRHHYDRWRHRRILSSIHLIDRMKTKCMRLRWKQSTRLAVVANIWHCMRNRDEWVRWICAGWVEWVIMRWCWYSTKYISTNTNLMCLAQVGIYYRF